MSCQVVSGVEALETRRLLSAVLAPHQAATTPTVPQSQIDADRAKVAADVTKLQADQASCQQTLQADRQATEARLAAGCHRLEAELETVRADYREIDEELQRLRATKLCRWSAPARRVYRKFRR